MAEKQLVVDLALKNSGFDKQLKSITSEMKLLESNFKKAEAGSDDFSNSLEGQKAKLDLLEGQYGLLQKKINVYNQQLEKAKETLDKSTTGYIKAEEKLKGLKEELIKAENEFGKSSKKVTELKEKIKDAEKAFETKANAVVNANNKLITIQSTINKTEAEAGKLQNEIKKLNSEMNDIESPKGLDDFKEELETSAKESVDFAAKLTIVGEGMQNVGEKASEAGDAILNGYGEAIKTVNEFDSAMNQIQASTMLTKEEMEEIEPIVKNVFAGNYGDSFDDVANAVGSINKYLWLTGEELQNATEKSFLMRDTFDYDINESVRTVNTLMKNFGVSSDEAFNLISQGAKQGLDFSDELLDSINEYSPQFKKAGLDAEDMFNIFYDGTQAGAWNLDKIGDAVKEFNIRLTDGSTGSAEALKTLGLNADEVATAMTNGGEKAKETYTGIIEKIMSMTDKQEQNLVGTALFGTMWEDLSPEVIGALGEIGDNFNKTIDTANEMNSIKYDDLGSALESLKRSTTTNIVMPLTESVMPIINELMPYIQKIIDAISNWVQENPKLAGTLVIVVGVIGVLLSILGVVVPIIGSMAIAAGALNIAMLPLTGTILLVIAAIAALIAIVVLVIAKWDEIKQCWANFCDWAIQKWTQFKEWMSQCWSGIKQKCSELAQAMVDWIIQKWNSFVDWIFGWGSRIQSSVSNIWSNIKNTCSNLAQGVVDGVRNAFSRVYDFITSPFKRAWDYISGIGSKIGGIISKINPFNWFSLGNEGDLTPVLEGNISPLSDIAKSGQYYTISNNARSSMMTDFIRATNNLPNVNSKSDINLGVDFGQFGTLIAQAIVSGLQNITLNAEIVTKLNSRELTNQLTSSVIKNVDKNISKRRF
ncbi:phage tail tape measure protein [Clostridium perfringens]|uniref:phage tail tape measure protein n=1 Tax=Clostridium perfringens TaxID=1502 RepID=UPI0003FDD349|nr:phage tail tape measure protein [Clostridium perfringens]